MKTYLIPQTDLTVSRIAYGCGMLAGWDRGPLGTEDTVRASRLIHTAHDQGINFFDHADLYGFGRSETLFGEVLKGSPGLRNKLVIQSKCGQVFPPEWQKWGDPIRVNLTRGHLVSSAEGSLKRLGTDHLDILLLHAPSALIEPDQVAEAFDSLHQSGKVRYFGVSNYTPAQIRLLKRSVRQPIVVNQIRLGLGYPETFIDGMEFTVALARGGGSALKGVRDGTLDFCRLENIQIQAWSPLRGDLLSPKPDSPREVRAAATKLSELAKAKETSPSALALAWLLHSRAGIVPVIGTTSPKHIIENCTADRLTLNDDEWYDLLAAAAP